MISSNFSSLLITGTEIFLLNAKDPLVAPFVTDLEHRVSSSNRAGPLGAGGSHTDLEAMGKAARTPVSPEAGLQESQSLLKSSVNVQINEKNDNSPRDGFELPKNSGPQVLPFEFKALEVCLESSCSRLEMEVLRRIYNGFSRSWFS
ncbi:hypothetical protein ACHQM5_024773 [Ranunculus cassubicifolius]